jgi:hypothetical protein
MSYETKAPTLCFDSEVVTVREGMWLCREKN